MFFIKLLKLLKVIYVSRIHFTAPPKNRLVIFDGQTIEMLSKVLERLDYFILETRLERIKDIYITKKICFRILRNFKKNFFSSYLIALLEEIDPKVIFTFVDNHYKFSEFALTHYKKYRFLALQNGARYEHKIFKLLNKKKLNYEIKRFCIPNYLCFGSHEIDDFKKTNQLVKKFKAVGSLKLLNYLNYKKNKSILKKKYDILLISDIYCWDAILEKLNFPIEKGLINLIKFTLKFAKKNNLKIKIAARNTKEEFKKEKEFYFRNLNPSEYNYLLKNILFRKNYFQTYEYMEKSKVVIGTMSTMLRENLALKGKSFACNYLKTDIFDFPIKGLCFTKKEDYLSFEKKLNKIISISHKDYLKNLSKNPTYIINPNTLKKQNTIHLVRSELNLLLKK